MEITDEMCQRAVDATKLNTETIQGFSTQTNGRWGPPHYILDMRLPPGKREIWRSGGTHMGMMRRIAIEEMRIALAAAHGQGAITSPRTSLADTAHQSAANVMSDRTPQTE